MHLLHTADRIKLNRLHPDGILKVCHSGIIKCNMSVLPDAHTDDIRRIVF